MNNKECGVFDYSKLLFLDKKWSEIKAGDFVKI